MPLNELVENRPAGVVYTRSAWQAVRSNLSLTVAWEVDIQEASLTAWEALLPGFRGKVVYAVGGGLAADAAKYIAVRKSLPLVCIPTALSVDAFLTWASGVRQDGCVRYIETKPPDRLVVDLGCIAAAPLPIRAAGISDVLSIATGCWDWKYAEDCGQNPPGMAYDPAAARIAQAILASALDCAESAGRGERAGLKQLLDCLVMEVVLCNQVGHSRPEEGSEHYFAYAVEHELGKVLPHGDLVGPGILTMARLQRQDTSALEKALRACHVPLDTLPAELVDLTLKRLPAYARQHNLPFGIAHNLQEVQTK